MSMILLASCSDNLLAPKPTSDLTNEDLWINSAYGGGLLGRAYQNLNYNYNITMDSYTDNAVPSTPGTNALALGSWTLEGNPIGEWNTSYNSIKYLNLFLKHAHNLAYQVGAPQQDSLTRSHRIGEAFYLRGWYEWQLLRDYGGYVDGSSEAMGVPIVTDVLSADSTINRPRDTYEANVKQIVTDLDSAIVRLPMQYDGTTDLTGPSNRGRASALAAMALKARVYLYAASPAYSNADQQLWERAAKAAYDAIDASGGLTDLKPYGNFNDYTSYDYIWIQPTYAGNGLERTYYPPSFFGNGSINPSQNLVDAFPAKDGYPIDQSSEYDKDHPYKNRDPRFEKFIFYNGDKYNGNFVRTYQGGPDAPGGLTQQGTRTGYYMEKHLSKNVQLNPGNETTDTKFKVLLGRTELYLNFAEAANEAYGPNSSTLGFSAADVMRKIRKRAGIDSDPSTAGYQDQYLTDQANAGKDAFRSFIHNERRLELSFEGQRFWDLRRWNDPLNHTLGGVTITASTGQGTQRNVALNSKTSTDYVSPWENLDAIKDGYEPQSSSDNSHGKYGNWNSAGLWRHVQYDFPSFMVSGGTDNTFRVDSVAVYWFSDGGGILLPDSTYIQYRDKSGNWTEVPNHSGYGTNGDQWNVTTFDPTETTGIRLYMKNNNQSCGVIEWKVWGKPVDPLTFSYQKRDVESHTYQDYMRYIPLPYNETLIMDKLKQNKGWQ